MNRIELPMPPSVNAMYSNARKGRVKSHTYKLWIQLAGLHLNTQHPQRFTGAVKIIIALVAQSNHRQDADNRVKAVLDLLKNHGVIQDDSNKFVKEINVRWMDQGPACSVTIQEIEEQAA